MRNNLKKALIFTIITLVLSHCGGGSSGKTRSEEQENSLCSLSVRILGGNSCSNLPSPVVGISITFEDGSSALCTGSIISEHAILTAAHCFLTSAVKSIDVYNSHETIEGKAAILHPGVAVAITGEVQNDLAIVTLEKSFSLVSPIPLSTRAPQSGTELLIYGYGLDEDGNSGVLRAGRLITSSISSRYLSVDARNGINPCNGDSGGPALMTSNGNYLIVGILSAGTSRSCEDNDTNFYTRVDSRSTRNFINKYS